jgi:hypothetical protein
LNSLREPPTHVGCRRLLQVIPRYIRRKPKPTELQRQLKAAQTRKFSQIDKRVSSIGDHAVYVRLGPENALDGVVFSDVAHMAPGQAQEEAEVYLRAEEVQKKIEALTQKILSAMGTAMEGTGQVPVAS